MKHRLVPDRGLRTQGEVATAYSTTRNAPDKTRYAGSTAFDGHRQERKRKNRGFGNAGHAAREQIDEGKLDGPGVRFG